METEEQNETTPEETTTTESAPEEKPKKRRRRGENTQLKYALVFPQDDGDEVMVFPDKTTYTTVAEVRKAIEDTAVNNPKLLQEIWEANATDQTQDLVFAVVRILDRFHVKTQTQTVVVFDKAT